MGSWGTPNHVWCLDTCSRSSVYELLARLRGLVLHYRYFRPHVQCHSFAVRCSALQRLSPCRLVDPVEEASGGTTGPMVVVLTCVQILNLSFSAFQLIVMFLSRQLWVLRELSGRRSATRDSEPPLVSPQTLRLSRYFLLRSTTNSSKALLTLNLHGDGTANLDVGVAHPRNTMTCTTALHYPAAPPPHK